MPLDFRNRSVSSHQFAMVPRADVPRSAFDRQMAHKSTFDAGYLVPVFVDEVLPGDTFNMKATMFARMATPIYPVMDNLYLDTFWFFVPNRLVWDNWVKFMGERANPEDSTSYVVPTIVSPTGGYTRNTIFDYMGLPTVGQVDGSSTVEHSALFLRAYNLIYNEWFRDQNLIDSLVVNKDDGPDLYTDYSLKRRGKRHDYFTGCLPWPQKGDSVSLPLGVSAPVYGDGQALGLTDGTLTYGLQSAPSLGLTAATGSYSDPIGTTYATVDGAAKVTGVVTSGDSGLYTDLTAATAATINQLRQSFQIQKLLERDARGGSRYTEIVRSHFGVISPDARLQRPEYLGGNSVPVNVSPIYSTGGVQTFSYGLGNPGAAATMLSRNGFTQSFTEHGMVIGLVNVRADLTYQQGLRRMWSRQTRYDFYFPVFANLGEQAVLNKEIYVKGTAQDDDVFGYQERWAEYRYLPSQITGFFRSTDATPLDAWHLSQEFGALPVLGESFIQEDPPLDRVLAVASSTGKQFLFDSVFQCRAVRPMPMYSVPGLIDHF